jgi:hypothetical protein
MTIFSFIAHHSAHKKFREIKSWKFPGGTIKLLFFYIYLLFFVFPRPFLPSGDVTLLKEGSGIKMSRTLML